MKMILEIINYFRNDEMVNSNTPFSLEDYELVLKEISKDKFIRQYLGNLEPFDEFKSKIQCLSNDELRRLYLKTKAKRFQDEIIKRWMVQNEL